MAKYNNIKYKGYDSIREYNRAQRLKLLERSGEISDLREQVRFELIPAQYTATETVGKRSVKFGRKLLERSVCYVADFQYLQGGELIVEDSKGVKTKEYIIKRKLMLHVYGIRIKEV